MSRKIHFRIPKGHRVPISGKWPSPGPFNSWGFPSIAFLHYGWEQDFLCLRNHSPDLTSRDPADKHRRRKETAKCLSPEPSSFGGVRAAAKFSKDHRT